METDNTTKLPTGVGKRIVDALKKDSVEIHKIEEESIEQVENTVEDVQNDEFYDLEENHDEIFDMREQESEDTYFDQEVDEETSYETKVETENFEYQEQQPDFPVEALHKPQKYKKQETVQEIEMPANIEILKRLISQLPPGVTRQTGAQIIRQTMEAMGISMKSVLSEAQLIQEELGGSAQDCMNTIEEYKNNIRMLEKKVQSYRKQAGQIGELINLFIMTEKKSHR